MKAILRTDASYNIARAIENSLQRKDIYRNCQTCTFINIEDKYNPICKKFNAKPPIEILVGGCDSYEDDDEIPF